MNKPKPTELKVDDVAATKDDVPRDKIGRRNPPRPNQKSRLKSSTHLNALAPIPESAYDNPVEWATKHLEKQIPLSAKELEWQLKFGSAKVRKEIAIEMLAFKGISNRGPNTGQVIPAIQLIMTGAAPWSQQGENNKTLPTSNRDQLVEGELVEVVSDTVKKEP